LEDDRPDEAVESVPVDPAPEQEALEILVAVVHVDRHRRSLAHAGLA
jgi:hypothetical protein